MVSQPHILANKAFSTFARLVTCKFSSMGIPVENRLLSNTATWRHLLGVTYLMRATAERKVKLPPPIQDKISFLTLYLYYIKNFYFRQIFRLSFP